ncbi:preprotein translocase subunit SecE [Ammonifex thiophilus]|uniref:Protein translocase subunit SecE n=1 Tax=Ammonifex thiophilus TaxID=444093 RepID=A0A3D8P7P9_9THEO|nr:preprotein translocase subunit SecE [Ammonifex thiophilus]RDV84912.1 preprotein translocase subunit SecE [Ammonifex thiophilus]
MVKLGKDNGKGPLPASKLVPLKRPKEGKGAREAASKAPKGAKASPIKAKEASKKKVDIKASIAKTREFFLSVWQELKKVHWPTRREVLIYTGVVLAAVGLVTLIIWLADSIFSQILRFILKV